VLQGIWYQTPEIARVFWSKMVAQKPKFQQLPGILAQTHLLDFDAAGELGHKLNSLVEVTR
jgi:hypothetical protein